MLDLIIPFCIVVIGSTIIVLIFLFWDLNNEKDKK